MQPASYDFPPVTRGDSEVLGFILKDQDLFSEQIALTDLSEAVVHWRVQIPGREDPVEKTTADDGGLTLDPATRLITWPMDPAFTAALGDKNPYRVRVIYTDGRVSTYLTGNIIAEGEP